MDSGWDFTALDQELAEIVDVDMSEFGFGALNSFIEENEAPKTFKEFTGEEEVKHKCPRCGYEWN